MDELLLWWSRSPKVQPAPHHPGYFPADDATMVSTSPYFDPFLPANVTQDWCQLHLLLLHTLPPIYRCYFQHLLDLSDLHLGQRLLDPHLILHR